MNRINVYFIKPPLGYKWIPGDKHVVNFLRRLFKGKKVSGLDKVLINLCKGFDELKINYVKNRPFKKIKPNEAVIVLGTGKHALLGYNQPNRVIAGIGLMSHPTEWPDLFAAYPVAKYLQHSDWANQIYIPYYGKEHCNLWPSGIDTKKWAPQLNSGKKFDLLVYNKVMWDKEKTANELRLPLLNKLDQLGVTWRQITYGQYKEEEYFRLLQECHGMIFLCEHESQGFACCEALSMNVPVFAWDQGYWLDPNAYAHGNGPIKATSVPFFDENCGMRFTDLKSFEDNIDLFLQKAKNDVFKSRNYILQNLTLKKSAERMLEIIAEVYGDNAGRY